MNRQTVVVSIALFLVAALLIATQWRIALETPLRVQTTSKEQDLRAPAAQPTTPQLQSCPDCAPSDGIRRFNESMNRIPDGAIPVERRQIREVLKRYLDTPSDPPVVQPGDFGNRLIYPSGEVRYELGGSL